MAKSLNGRWYSKTDPAVSLAIEKTYKKGYVTGFKYTTYPHKNGNRIVHEKFRAEYKEIEAGYTRTPLPLREKHL